MSGLSGGPMGDHGMPLCMTCRHWDEDDHARMSCTAFPRGIPEAILLSRRDHRRPYRGDRGIRYEHRPGSPPPPSPEDFEDGPAGVY